VWWNAGWIPIFDTGGLSKIALDCTGPPDTPAPLRQFDWDAVGAHHYARAFAPSLGEYIARAVRSLSAGRYHYDADQDQSLPMDWANTPAGDRF
jgi:cell wall assembly regulator SMI1